MNIPQWNGKFLKEFADQHRSDQMRKHKIKNAIKYILIALAIGGVIWLIQ